jgi:hypothetical protein
MATVLASDIGSVMHGPADAFSCSVTFFKKTEEIEEDWSLANLDGFFSFQKKRDQNIVLQ